MIKNLTQLGFYENKIETDDILYQFLKKYDKDHDGKIDPSEFKEFVTDVVNESARIRH